MVALFASADEAKDELLLHWPGTILNRALDEEGRVRDQDRRTFTRFRAEEKRLIRAVQL